MEFSYARPRLRKQETMLSRLLGKIMKLQVAPVEKTAAPKKEKKQPLQEIYGDDGFDEEHSDGVKK